MPWGGGGGGGGQPPATTYLDELERAAVHAVPHAQTALHKQPPRHHTERSAPKGESEST